MDFLGAVSRKHQDWFDEKTKKSSDSLKRSTKVASIIPALYLGRRPIQTYVRQSSLGLVLSFFPRDDLDEIWHLIKSVSEGFPTYFLEHARQDS